MPARKRGAKFEKLPSGSLRVRVRMRGHTEASATFPLFLDTPQERLRQRAEAEEWAAQTKRKMLSGTHVSMREAETMTLGDALERYRDEGLSGKAANVRKDQNRIKQILADPIAKRTIASLRTSDVASYRDLLQGRAKEQRGKPLARTTVSNKTQLISRALSHVGEKMEGVPDVTGVKMPRASPGRDRRVAASEMESLLREAERINPLLPLVIQFAVLTTLRRERILTFTLSNVHTITNGRKAIRFPRNTSKREKKAGIVPVTRDIQALIDAAVQIQLKKSAKLTYESAVPVFSINPNTLDTQWRKATNCAGCVDLHFHDLRHEGTSRLFERGLNIAEVMTITEHSTKEMVDRYSHYSVVLILEKLEKEVKPEDIAADFLMLIQTFSHRGGDIKHLQRMIINSFAAVLSK